ncbi:Hypothetical predicted protein [Olea europaea subsp. europaea]|uniref:Uncharacterized protein n=1 Tax=Olea europaea subsp. europaea TaxID=158383 RepID=A0A8S0TXC5_OLEEU|nr:Hypothetical predicted protein [Olea europaea subsp. europaea]
MSVLQYKEGVSSNDLQIWNNDAFDNGDLKEISGNKPSWSPIKPMLLNSTELIISDSSSKENEGPLFENPISSVSSSLRSVVAPFKPVNVNGASENLKTRGISKQAFEEKVDLKSFDEEIEEIEMEIKRLTSRLEALKLEKADSMPTGEVDQTISIILAAVEVLQAEQPDMSNPPSSQPA